MSSSFSEDDDIIFTVISQVQNTVIQWQSNRDRAPGSRPNIERGVCPWYRDYLSQTTVYNFIHVKERFCVPLSLYWKFECELPNVEPKLLQLYDATGRPGATTWKNACIIATTG